jgi:hypothetical protein
MRASFEVEDTVAVYGFEIALAFRGDELAMGGGLQNGGGKEKDEGCGCDEDYS